jgi:hypothetical protein
MLHCSSNYWQQLAADDNDLLLGAERTQLAH